MRLLITGASGFLGQRVVRAAVDRGHRVRALIRTGSKPIPAGWIGDEQIDVVRHDLRKPAGIEEALGDVDCVIHLAASKSGDLYEQIGGTITATENLLSAMVTANVQRMVLTSSFAVYEYLSRWSWSLLDEDSPLACNVGNRDEYSQTKLFQEQLVRECAAEHDWHLAVLRPGVIFGRDNLWSARLGTQMGRWWFCTGMLNEIPLTYVDNCADAVVRSAEYAGPDRELILNVLDTRLRALWYLLTLRRKVSPRPIIIPIPWILMRSLARTAWLANRVLFKGNGKVPSVLVPARLHARCRPLRYSNARLRRALGWAPRVPWRDGLEKSVRADAVPSPPSSKLTHPVAVASPGQVTS